MNLIPLFDRVILKPIQTEKILASGLIIPPTPSEKPSIAKVVAVGSGITEENQKTNMVVKVNDTVIYSVYAGIEFKNEKETLVLIKQTDILAILKEENNETN